MATAFGNSREGISFQCVEIFRHSGINQIGEKKHELKEEIRAELKEKGISATWHNIAKEMGITGSKSADNNLQIWIQCANYCKAEFGLEKIENIKSKHIEAFLTDRVMDGISRNTFKADVAGLEKFETALNWTAEKFDTGKQYHFTSALDRVKELAYSQFGEKETYSRHYENPEKIVDNMSGKYQIAAELQLYGGARISEACHIKLENFKGIVNHPLYGQVGQIHLENDATKGGRPREMYVPVNIYNKAYAEAQEKGVFHVDRSTFRNKLEIAAGDQYKGRGCHGLRWSFCQNMAKYLIDKNVTWEKTLSIVSNLCGHSRLSITCWYIFGGRR